MLVMLAGLLAASCSSVRPAQQKPGTSDKSRETQQPQVYNPSTGKYEPVEDPKKLVDTLRFSEDKHTPPATTIPDRKTGKKEIYEIAFLMPFDAAKYTSAGAATDTRVRRFVHYYAGAKLALDDLYAQGIRIHARVYDTRESVSVSKNILQNMSNPDAIVGPYEVESLRDAATLSTRKRIPVFSPWTPSISLDNDCPYFVQLNPGLEAHAGAIIEFISKRFTDAKIYLVARDDMREKGRLSLYRDAASKRGMSTRCEDLIISDASADLARTSLTGITSRTQHTIFILPLFSRNDEDFINAFLRKLHAEKGSHSVSVFGLPQWLSFSRLNVDYLESTNVHVSTSHFMDPSDIQVKDFQRRFLEIYGTLPEPAAHQGYTFVRFLGRALHRHGTEFLDDITDQTIAAASQEYYLVSAFRNPVPERRNVANYIENRAIQILRFVDHAFRKA